MDFKDLMDIGIIGKLTMLFSVQIYLVQNE